LRCKCFSLFWNSVKPFPLPATPTLPLGSSGELKMLSFLRPERKPTWKKKGNGHLISTDHNANSNFTYLMFSPEEAPQ